MAKRRTMPSSLALAGLATTCLTGWAAAGEMEPSRNAIQIYVGAFGGGVIADRHVTDGSAPVEPPEPSFTDAFGTFGGLAGVTVHEESFFYSLEGDIGAVLDGNVDCDGIEARAFWCDPSWKAHVRARIGTSIDSIDVFVAGGLALAEVGGTSDNYVVPGWSVGGGIDAKFSDSMMGRVELLYDHFDSDVVGQGHIGAPGSPDAYHGRWSDLTVRAALIFEF